MVDNQALARQREGSVDYTTIDQLLLLLQEYQRSTLFEDVGFPYLISLLPDNGLELLWSIDGQLELFPILRNVR